jgi:hypothetical protein
MSCCFQIDLSQRFLVSASCSDGQFTTCLIIQRAFQVYKDQLGIPSGFLGQINQTEEGNSIRLNLTMDTIRAIFRTYPVGRSFS